jgi:hypothetical protein
VNLVSKIILTATALLLVVVGLALDFLPQEAATCLGLPAAAALTVILQCLAAALLGLGYLDWLSRANLMGGIYSRPLALANLLFFAVSAITLVRFTAEHATPTALRVASIVASVFAILFAWLMFFHDPTRSAKQA